MSTALPTRKQATSCLGLLGLVLLAIYARSLTFPFVAWDDGLLITENATVHGFTPANIWKAFTTYDPELYIPLTLISYQIDYLFAGLSPFLYHFENLLTHLLNAALVCWFIFLLTGRRWIAAVTALLFAVHPLHTEAVVWASARKDVLSTAFFLCTLIAYLLYRRTGEKSWYRRSIVALLLALFSKVIAITAPIILLLLDWREGRKIDRANLREKAPYFLLSFVFGLVALGGKTGSDNLLFEKILIGSKAITLYLSKLLFPTGLSVLYPYTNPIALLNPDLLSATALVLVLTALAWWSRCKTREIFFGWCFFLITVLPTFSNFAKGEDTLKDIYIGSDRYAYIPSIGLLFLASLLIYKLIQRKPQATQGTLALFVVLLSFQAYTQSLVWGSTEALFSNVLTYYPNSHLAHNNLGTLRFREGEYDAAFDHYRQSIRIRPNGEAYYNLGQFYSEMGQQSNAMDSYKSALEHRPADVSALINLGVLEMRAGKTGEAVTHFEAARELEPSFSTIHYNLATVYELQGRVEDARRAYERVLEIDPEDSEVRKRLQEF
jgi:tetratricopeptide (TPR) repeat protein